MSTDTQNGSHLTAIDTPEKLRAELDRVAGLIQAEQARIAQSNKDFRTVLVDPEDDEPQPETDALPPINKRKVAAVVWLAALGMATTGAIGYRISQEGIPDLPSIFTVTQVGSVENGEG